MYSVRADDTSGATSEGRTPLFIGECEGWVSHGSLKSHSSFLYRLILLRSQSRIMKYIEDHRDLFTCAHWIN